MSSAEPEQGSQLHVPGADYALVAPDLLPAALCPQAETLQARQVIRNAYPGGDSCGLANLANNNDSSSLHNHVHVNACM